MPFDIFTDELTAIDTALDKCEAGTGNLTERRTALLEAIALADDAGPMITRDEWKRLALAAAAVTPTPRKPADPKPQERLDHLTTRLANVVEHDVEPGFYLPRYAPPGFPTPIWSDADLTRPDGRRFGKTGNQLLADRRKPWQKETKARFDRTGHVCTSFPKF